MFDKNLFISDDFNGAATAFAVRVKEAGPDTETSFSSQRIDRISKISDEISVIKLASGLDIPVAMPYAELEKQIYFRDIFSPRLLDLTEVTGNKVNQHLVFKFVAVIRQANTSNYKEYTFTEDQIDWNNRDSITSKYSKAGHSTRISLRNTPDPFNDNHDKIFIDMPIGQLEFAYEQAKKNGRLLLDLRTGSGNGNTPSPS